MKNDATKIGWGFQLIRLLNICICFKTNIVVSNRL
jgi:hypothetical protein